MGIMSCVFPHNGIRSKDVDCMRKDSGGGGGYLSCVLQREVTVDVILVTGRSGK